MTNGMDKGRELMAERERATFHPLDNPDRRHEPDGVVNPALAEAQNDAGEPKRASPDESNAQVIASRPMLLPSDPNERKNLPITSGVLDYFPLALAEVARVSKAGNDQHNPGQPLHWAKGKSTDHADCISRHLIDRGARDSDGMRHSAKLAWRALALLQTELEDEASR
jgi:hypothetical protein